MSSMTYKDKKRKTDHHVMYKDKKRKLTITFNCDYDWTNSGSDVKLNLVESFSSLDCTILFLPDFLPTKTKGPRNLKSKIRNQVNETSNQTSAPQ